MAIIELGRFEGKRYAWDPSKGVCWYPPDVREAVRAGENRKLVISDYSQIEVRLIAFLSQEMALIKALNDQRDIHCHMASICYSEDYDLLYHVVALKDKKHPRFNALSAMRAGVKTVTFGLPYGAGPRRIAQMIRMPGESMEAAVARASELIETYFRNFPEIEFWLNEQRQMAQDPVKGYTATVLGRRRWYRLPDVRNPDYGKLMGQIGRWAGNQPVQGCVSGWTNIFDKNQGYVPIQSLSGKRVTVWDGSRWAKARVAASGPKELVRTTFMNGMVLETSPDHRLKVVTPKVERWMTVAELEDTLARLDRKTHKNYRVVLAQGLPGWELKSKIPDAPRGRAHNAIYTDLKQITDPQDLGLWLGRVASDGSVNIKPNDQGGVVSVFVAEHEKEIYGKLRELTAVFGISSEHSEVGHRNDPFHSMVVCKTSLAKQLLACGIKTQIPPFVWKSRAMLAGYLQGMFDGDGIAYEHDGACLTFGKGDQHLRWAREIQQALRLFGVRSRVRFHKGKSPKSRKGCVRVQIQKFDMPKFAREIGFLNSKKQKLAEAVKGQSIKGQARYGEAVSIRSIVRTGLMIEMYDVVDSETGQFAANGLVVHNSSADILKDSVRRLYKLHRGGKMTCDMAFNDQLQIWQPKKEIDANILLVCHDEIVTDSHVSCVERAEEMLCTAMKDAYESVSMQKTTRAGTTKTVYLRDIYNKVDAIVADYWAKD